MEALNKIDGVLDPPGTESAIGERLAFLMKVKGIGQSELAARCGKVQSHISAIINGRSSPGQKLQAELARELG